MRRARAVASNLAKRRLLDPSPAAVERLETSIAAAVDALRIEDARRLLQYRLVLSEKLHDSRADQELLTSLTNDLDWLIADAKVAKR